MLKLNLLTAAVLQAHIQLLFIFQNKSGKTDKNIWFIF